MRWFPSGKKPEETELLCGVQAFQDEGAFSLE